MTVCPAWTIVRASVRQGGLQGNGLGDERIDDRSEAMRVSALAAHRAAKVVDAPAAHAAMAAGDSAYLHPLADALQVGHILRGPYHSVLALVLRPGDPLSRGDAEAIVVREATPTVVEVLRRYPRVDMRSPAVVDVMMALDARLRDPP